MSEVIILGFTQSRKPKVENRKPKADDYCAAFTSFQISLYFARRGTFCQK